MNKPKTAKNAPKGSVRIIAGKHRGRKLPVLMAEGLRPTTDRVKETVFNWLTPYLPNSKCLDCFAGSGGLGFEAQSRGANTVTLVELNRAAAKQLQQNKEMLSANNLTIENMDIINYLNQCTEKFSVVFLDPPFRKGLLKETTQLLNDKALIPEALIYVEMENDSNTDELPVNWQLLKEKIAGQVAYRLYQHS